MYFVISHSICLSMMPSSFRGHSSHAVKFAGKMISKQSIYILGYYDLSLCRVQGSYGRLGGLGYDLLLNTELVI